jgi:hypothetical protein
VPFDPMLPIADAGRETALQRVQWVATDERTHGSGRLAVMRRGGRITDSRR